MSTLRFMTSRRAFLATLAAGAGAATLRPPALHAAQPGPQAASEPRLAQVLASTIAVDMHSHVTIPFGKGGTPLPDFDLAAEMRRSGFTAVLQTYGLDGIPAGTVGDYGHYRQSMAFEDRLLLANDVHRALTLQDLEDAHAKRQPVIVQAIEGAQFIEGRLERLEEAYLRGLRCLQPVHERDDSVKPLADVYSRDARHGGLTAFGAEVIRACNRLGIVIDFTHLSYAAVRAALKVSTQPAIFSHTNLPPESPAAAATVTAAQRPPTFSREEARDIAAAGGLIGLWYRGAATARQYVENLQRLVEAVGIDHVGIGTDANLQVGQSPIYIGAIWKGETRGFFPAVAEEMLRAGFAPTDITKVGGGNFCRVFGAVTRTASGR